MRAGQPSLELGPASHVRGSHVRALTAPPRGVRTTHYPVVCASQDTPRSQANSGRPGLAARAIQLHSKAIDAAPDREQVQEINRVKSAAAAPSTEEVSAPAPLQPGLTSRMQSWLPWSQSIPLASQLGAPLADAHSHVADDIAFMGDGMASAAPTVAQPTSRRGWYIMSRRRGAGSKLEEASGVVVPEPRPVQVNHASIQLLRQRVVMQSRPGERTDDFKLGLVVEGGGMRGCVSGGALQALNDLGVRDAFDAVYGSSAGAINGTYFLSGQRDGVCIYHDHIASQEFIDLKRLISRRAGAAPALNLEFLLNNVVTDILPLNFEAVLSSPIPLKVVASSLETLAPMLLQDFTGKEDLLECLRASATVPEVAGGPVHHRGHRFVDAAVFEAVPFRSAIADGCTHVLVLCTRPAPARRSYLDQALSDAVEAVVKRAVMSPEYMVPVWRAEVESLVKDGLSQDEMLLRALDTDAHELPWFAGSHVYPVYPEAAATAFSPLCIDVPTLKNGVQEGRRSVMAIARAALSDVIDMSRFEETAQNIVPMTKRASESKQAVVNGKKRHMADAGDFSSHHSAKN